MKSDLAEFVENAEQYWSDMETRGAAAANKRVRRGTKMVAEWVKEGVALDNLTALMTHESPRVRLSACAHLMAIDRRDDAIAVLLRLTEDPLGFVAPSAAAVLRIYGIKTSLK